MADLVEVLRTPDLAEAKLVVAALEERGLTPTLLAENLAATLGASSVIIPRRVMVPETEEAEARATIEVMRAMAEADPDTRSDPEICPHCAAPWEPGFDVCWQCGKEP